MRKRGWRSGPSVSLAPSLRFLWRQLKEDGQWEHCWLVKKEMQDARSAIANRPALRDSTCGATLRYLHLESNEDGIRLIRSDGSSCISDSPDVVYIVEYNIVSGDTGDASPARQKAAFTQTHILGVFRSCPRAQPALSRLECRHPDSLPAGRATVLDYPRVGCRLSGKTPTRSMLRETTQASSCQLKARAAHRIHRAIPP